MPNLAATALLVRDYDEAIAFFTGGKRWVRVGWPHTNGCSLLLARAANPEQLAQVGRQSGGRVSYFIHTEDFARDQARLLAAGVHFEESPRREGYGTVAVFRDLYGNRWDLIQPK